MSWNRGKEGRARVRVSWDEPAWSLSCQRLQSGSSRPFTPLPMCLLGNEKWNRSSEICLWIEKWDIEGDAKVSEPTESGEGLQSCRHAPCSLGSPAQEPSSAAEARLPPCGHSSALSAPAISSLRSRKGEGRRRFLSL